MNESQDLALRDEVVAAIRRLDALGLNRGSTGNASVRASAGGFWITPTGVGAADVDAANLAWVSDDGNVRGNWQPSSEWPMHRAIYTTRADIGAVVHMHSVHATALACLGESLPAFHYMVAVAGGDDVPCVPYRLFGSVELSLEVAAAFAARDACLLGNHGLVAGGASVARAMKVAVEIEALCESYLKARTIGAPALLTREQMAEVLQKFKSYGKAARRT